MKTISCYEKTIALSLMLTLALSACGAVAPQTVPTATLALAQPTSATSQMQATQTSQPLPTTTALPVQTTPTLPQATGVATAAKVQASASLPQVTATVTSPKTQAPVAPTKPPASAAATGVRTTATMVQTQATATTVEAQPAATVPSTAQPTLIPVERVLPNTLPRTVQFANLQFTVTKATITNQLSSDSEPLNPDTAYARVDLSVQNPLTKDIVRLDPGLVQLQLGTGKLYDEETLWYDHFDPLVKRDTQLRYTVPVSATWQGAKLVLTQAGKEPAVLALDGPASTPSYPVTLPPGGKAKPADLTYEVLTATVSLDYAGERADLGKRFLIFAMRITNTSATDAQGLSADNFRLLVEGRPFSPVANPNEYMQANSTFEGSVIFDLPATATQLELEVGQVGEATAKIPVDLKAAKP